MSDPRFMGSRTKEVMTAATERAKKLFAATGKKSYPAELHAVMIIMFKYKLARTLAKAGYSPEDAMDFTCELNEIFEAMKPGLVGGPEYGAVQKAFLADVIDLREGRSLGENL